MANDSFSQQALAQDVGFVTRVEAALVIVAFAVLGEAANTPNHANRVLFCNKVISDPANFARRLSPVLVMRTNLMAFVTSYSFQTKSITTAAGDTDIQSQLTSDWDALAASN